MSITEMTALSLAQKLHTGELKITQALDAYYAAIGASDLNCYTVLCKEQAYARAAEVQARLDAGDARSALAGVPVAVTDLICTMGIETTCGSNMLRGFVPPFDAAVIEKLAAADLILLGKTNLDEFAMGSSTQTSAFGPTKNPHDPARTPGGSAGGAAAAVAAGEAPIALGSDTGGGLRQPASHCGVTGLKPTYGAVSRHGLVAYASSMDQIGPIARDAADCAALFGIIQGKDERDSTSMAPPAPAERPPLKKGALRVGLPKEFFGEGVSPEVAEAVLALKDKLAAQGAQVGECSLPLTEYAVPAYYILACAEASSNLARFDGIKYGHASEKAQNLRDTYLLSRSEGFGMEAKQRVMLGNLALSAGQYDAYYNKALRAKRLIQQSFFDAFEEFDVLLAPAAPTTAPLLGETGSTAMCLGDVCTVPASIAGLPALSVPSGTDANGMPIGAQLIGRPFEEGVLLEVASSLSPKTPPAAT